MVEKIQIYILMHKNIPVAQIRLPSVTAAVSAAGEIFTPAHVAENVAYSGEDIERQEDRSCCKLF